MPIKRKIADKKAKNTAVKKQSKTIVTDDITPKPHGNQRVSDSAIVAALKRAQGLISLAADVLSVEGYKITRSGLSKRVRKNSKLQQVMEECTEELLDVAEAKLLSKIHAGNVTAMIFYLKSKGGARGYGDRHEITGKDGGPIEVHGTADLSKLSEEELIALEKMLAKMESPSEAETTSESE